MTAVVEMSLAGAGAPLLVIPRASLPVRPWRRRRRWERVCPDAALAALRSAPEGALVLARRGDVDPGASCVGAVARILGRDVATLPDDRDAACWVVAVAAEWCRVGLHGLGRAVDVACGLAGSAAAAAMPPAGLARWAARAWIACAWCRVGGGLPGGACARCGAPVPAVQGVDPGCAA